MARKYKPKTKPFRHQSRATLAALRHRNYGLFMEPRCGKSKAALDYTGVMRLRNEVRRVAIVCPKVALDVWDDEIYKHYPGHAAIEDHKYEWSHPGDKNLHVRFLLMGHERLAKRGKRKRGKVIFARASEKKGRWCYPYIEELEDFDPDLIIDDESHRHKKPGGVGAQALWRSVERLRARRRAQGDTSGRPWVLLLSGTPRPRSWKDLFAQFRIMDPTIFGTNSQKFEEKHCVYGYGSMRFKIIHYNNKPQMLRKIRKNSITVTAEQAGLANKMFWQRLRVELPSQARRMYNELVEEYITVTPDGEYLEAKNAAVVRTRLLQVTGGFTKHGAVLHRAKVDALKQYLALLLDQGEWAVVYARHTSEVEASLDVARRVGYETFRFDGKTSSADRRTSRKALRRYSPRVPPRVLIAQVQAGSMSMEFAGAAEAVYLSLPDGWEAFRQSYARLLGPNQPKPVRYTVITAIDTIDISLIHSLRSKEDGHDEMMNHPRAYLMGL